MFIYIQKFKYLKFFQDNKMNNNKLKVNYKYNWIQIYKLRKINN